MHRRSPIGGVVLLISMLGGCGAAHPSSSTPLAPVAAIPPRSIEIHYKRDLPGNLPRWLDESSAGQKYADRDAQAAYAVARRNGWFECLDIFQAGGGTLPTIPPVPSGGDHDLPLLRQARQDGWKRCTSDLRTRAIDRAIPLATLRPALKPPPWFERAEEWFNAPVRYHRLEQGDIDLAFAFSFPKPLSREHAMELLLKTTEFTASVVGIGGRSRQVLAFNRIRAEPDAADAFADLLHRAQPAGRLFALAGLYLTDRAQFERESLGFSDDTEEIRYRAGCSIDYVSIKILKNRVPVSAGEFVGSDDGSD